MAGEGRQGRTGEELGRHGGWFRVARLGIVASQVRGVWFTGGVMGSVISGSPQTLHATVGGIVRGRPWWTF